MAKRTKRAGVRTLAPRTLMMSYGYDPALSNGAVKPPVFKTSTWVFPTAEAGEEFFEQLMGKRKTSSCDGYSRFSHPGMEFFEGRVALWERAEACAAFGSGMAGIFTTLLSLLKPGDLILHSDPLYGGTASLIKKLLAERMGAWSVGFTHADSFREIVQKVESMRKTVGPLRLAVMFVETPANPTNALFDLALCKRVRDHFATTLVVDNTFLGPLFQHPLDHGADLVVYSCTKYIGGHSTAMAGACLGKKALVENIRKMRGTIGDMLDPDTASSLLNSLETLEIRMESQHESARKVALFLAQHKKVTRVYYPGFRKTCGSKEQWRIYKAQCSGAAAVISFDVAGNKKAAFRFLNALAASGIVKLAVSLGSTESLVTHPASTTHAGIDAATRTRLGITDSMIRLSVGGEDVDDLIFLLNEALKKM